MFKKINLFIIILYIALTSTGICKDSPVKLQKTAIVFYRQGKYRAAVVYCDRLIKMDQKSAWAYNCKGSLLKCLFQYNESEESYKKALELSEEFPGHQWNKELKHLILINLGILSEIMGDYNKSEEYYDKAEEDYPKAKLIIQVHRCNLLISKGKIDRAKKLFDEIYKKISEISPVEAAYDKGKTYSWMAFIAMQLGKQKRALECSEKSYKLLPDSLTGIIYAKHLQLSGEPGKAEDIFNKVKKDKIPPILMAEYFAAKGDVNNCIKYLSISKKRNYKPEAKINWQKQFTQKLPFDAWGKVRDSKEFREITGL